MARGVNPQGCADCLFQNIVAALDIDKSERVKVFPCENHWHWVFLIVREVLRETVMAQVAGEKHIRVQPANKTIHPQKHSIQPPRLEHFAMAKLVHAIDRKVNLHPIQHREREGQ